MKGKALIFGLGCFIFFGIAFTAYGQNKTVSGTVTDASTKKPLPAVNIGVKGTTQGTTTDAEGKYSLSVPSIQDTLIFSFIGYQQQTVPINGRTTINIQMVSSVISGQQLVVTGYMKQKQADISGAVTVVPTADLHKNHGSTNVLNTLQGEIPGLQVTNSGNPTGGDLHFRIRGITSITHNVHPLIVIDGVPNYGMNLRDMNSNNIASMQVLKGAEAASIYGSQASGGVILIETKKGHPGKTQVTYHGSYGFAQVMNPPHLLNTQQYGRALFWASVNSNKDPNVTSEVYNYDWNNDYDKPVLKSITPIQWLNKSTGMPSANTNWMDAVLHRGVQNNQQINISGGTQKHTTFFSLNYLNNEGTQIYTKYKRFTARLNSTYHAINNHLTVGENISASHMLINDQNRMHDAMIEPPIVPVYTNDGGWGGTATGKGMGDYWNPVRELTLNKRNGNKFNKLFGNVYAQIDFLDHFTLKSKLGLYYTAGNHRTISFKFNEGGGKLQDYNAVDEWFQKTHRLNLTNTLEYKTSVKKNNIDFLLGMESNEYYTSQFDANRRGIKFQNYNYAYIDAATGTKSMSGSGDKARLLSYFSKINYNYNSKYLLSASVRYDGSSKFGINNQYGVFPAFSAGWRLSHEKFLRNNPVISNLKLRGGWGMTGNSDIPSTAIETFFLSNYNGTAYAISGQKTGHLPSGYYKFHTGNPNLHWEATQETDVGLDFGLFNQKLTGSFDWYHKATNGMLFNPAYLGAIGEGGGQWLNAADMINRGVEAVLKFNGNVDGKFSYSIRGNISHNHNEVTSLPQSVKYAYGGNGLDDDIVGHPLHSFYGYVVKGIFQNQKEVDNAPKQKDGVNYVGGFQYKDLNGDGVVGPDHDRKWLGSSDPFVAYGLNFSANYKNFDFSMFWQGIAGNVIFNGWATYSDFWNVYVQNGFNHPVRVLKAWNWQNTNSAIPELRLADINNQTRLSSYLIQPGGYLKLRNIELGYSLPARVMSQWGIEKIHVYVMAQNIVNIKNSAFTGWDPENASGSSYANPYIRPQKFKLGLDIKF
jgi:TonB-linked SusC/RagA family outer membrane protein